MLNVNKFTEQIILFQEKKKNNIRSHYDDKFISNLFPSGFDEVMLKNILESLIHINALNRMEINL